MYVLFLSDEWKCSEQSVLFYDFISKLAVPFAVAVFLLPLHSLPTFPVI